MENHPDDGRLEDAFNSIVGGDRSITLEEIEAYLQLVENDIKPLQALKRKLNNKRKAMLIEVDGLERQWATGEWDNSWATTK